MPAALELRARRHGATRGAGGAYNGVSKMRFVQLENAGLPPEAQEGTGMGLGADDGGLGALELPRVYSCACFCG